MKLKKSRNQSPYLHGLWLCRKTSPKAGIIFRSALLFAEGNGKHYILRLNHSDRDENGVTIFFLWDYVIVDHLIRQHPLSYPDDLLIDVPWRTKADGGLLLQFDEGADIFYPATWDDVFAIGIEAREVEQALRELEELGCIYTLQARFPESESERLG